MNLQFFNTLNHKIESFNPLQTNDNTVGFYCCGPTVYDFAHIGNFRTFVFADLVRRFLEFKGYNVNHVMNITDVDDKIIKRVNGSTQKISRKDYTNQYEKAFFDDFLQLNCLKPKHIPHASEYIPQMCALIQKLMDNGIAYQTSDGSIFFSIKRYIELGGKYGQLAKINFDESRIGERIKNDEYEKENVADFALWKARIPSDGDVYWDSPWGQGRPGWHLECSAMSRDLLGDTFDIHVGGEDLVFPHHEDEIAQSEGSTLSAENHTPTPFVKYWLHFSHLLSEGKKMSKSLGNFYTLRELFAEGYTGREIRYLLLSAHYRESLNFTKEGLNAARTALTRLDECLMKLAELAGNTTGTTENSSLVQDFDDALSNDLNLSAAWAVVFEWVREINKLIADNKLTPQKAADALASYEKINTVLGIEHKKQVTDDIPVEIKDLLEARQAARKAKDFSKSDAIRDELKSKGWVIEDTPKGARLKKL